MFITFEGIDGSGKTTAINYLKNYLEKKNIDCVFTREPGTFCLSVNKVIRKIITSKNSKISSMTEAILFSADRREHLEKLIWPSLKKNKIVICDRYFDSTFAYQGYGRELGIEKMIDLQENITNKTYPNLTFYFNISIEMSLERIKKSQYTNRIDNESIDFFKKVKYGYKQVIKKYPKRFIIIDSSKTEKEVFKEVLSKFKKLVLKS